MTLEEENQLMRDALESISGSLGHNDDVITLLREVKTRVYELSSIEDEMDDSQTTKSSNKKKYYAVLCYSFKCNNNQRGEGWVGTAITVEEGTRTSEIIQYCLSVAKEDLAKDKGVPKGISVVVTSFNLNPYSI